MGCGRIKYLYTMLVVPCGRNVWLSGVLRVVVERVLIVCHVMSVCGLSSAGIAWAAACA